MRIFLIDSQPIFRAGLKSVLQNSSEMSVSAEADSWRTLPEGVWENYDLIILDGGVESLIFLQTLAKSRMKGRPPFVLVLSRYPDELEATQMLAAGANGYVDKGKQPVVILDAIRKVARGGRYVCEELMEAVTFSKNRVEGPARLSRREYQVLCLLGAGLGMKQIAGQLSLSVKTISTYRFRLLEKLNLTNNAQLVKYVIKQGVVPD